MLDDTGERCIGKTIEDIRAWKLPNGEQHYERYEWVIQHMRCGSALDCACGVGYGSHMMATSPGIETVIGVDIEPAAIDYAQRYWSAPNIEFIAGDMLDLHLSEPFQNIVSLETLEHCQDPALVLAKFRTLMTPDSMLFASIPIIKSTHFNKFHKFDIVGQRAARDYFATNGFTIIDTMNQDNTYLTLQVVL